MGSKCTTVTSLTNGNPNQSQNGLKLRNRVIMGNKRKPGTIVCDATVELNEDVSRYIFSSSLVVL